jgi:hypothetical protein
LPLIQFLGKQTWRSYQIRIHLTTWTEAHELLRLLDDVTIRASHLVSKMTNHRRGCAQKSAPVMETALRRDGKDMEQTWRRDLLALVQRDRQAVLKVALGYLQNAADAEDVAQDVFLKACQRLAAGVPLAQLTRAWMLRVTVNTAIDRRRSSWLRRSVLVDRIPEQPIPEAATLAQDRRGTGMAVNLADPVGLRHSE